MTANKTVPTTATVDAWLDALEPDRQADARALVAMMREASGEEPRMWGSIVGFGAYHYRYESGREGDAMRVGFAARKADLTLYLMDGFAEREALLERLGKHKVGKACLYVKRLDAIDLDVLNALIRASLAAMAVKHPPAP